MASARRAGQRAEGSLQAPSFSHRQILQILWTLQACVFVGSFSNAVVATALPTIAGDLGSQDQLSWVVSAALLTSTVSMPLWGKVSDLYGRKPLMLAAIALFAFGSAMSGLSQSMVWLVAARAGQGIGVGGIAALSQAIMADVVTLRERGRYAGYFTAGGASYGVATAIGPFIGGFLVDGPGWRWCFYVGIPIAVVAPVVLQRTLRVPVVRRETSIDWLGAMFITASATALLLLLSLAGKHFAWVSGWAVLLVVVGAVCLVTAVFVERRAVEPILPPRLFRDRTFCLTGVAGFFAGFALLGSAIYLPQFLQVVRGMSPTASGLVTVPMVVSMLLVSVLCGRSITRWGRWKVFPLLGLVVVAAAAALLSTLSSGTSVVVVFGYAVLFGIGLGMTVQVVILAVQNTCEPRDLGVATSSATFFRSMGGTVGISLFGAILSSQFASTIPAFLAARHVGPPSGPSSSYLGTPAEIAALPEPLRSAVREGFTLGLDRGYLVTVPLVLLGALALLGVNDVPPRDRTPHEARVAELPVPDSRLVRRHIRLIEGLTRRRKPNRSRRGRST